MANHKDPVAVLGLGRFGTALALELARGGTEVLAVDNRPDIVQRLSGQLGQVVIADTTDADALSEIGIADFSRVVVAIGGHLEASILTTALLSELEIPTIWAKAVTRQQATILSRIGAHHVVFPEQEMGERIAHLVAGRLLDWVELDPQWVFAKTKPPREIVGVPLGQTGLRKKHHVTVVSVKAENTASYTHADYDTVLTYGAEIVIAGRPTDVERFVELQ
ncbi:TrkA family potassium uptake protein [Modestobacter sp. VKM Ac-2979]|uniref:potassium channel family protein n=1 Tax=unclassified Modestobacter TaxID=2643866 RepID=UPI0022ABBA6E|nr:MULTISPECIES: TrkA family potassium uptake protein [unclassified Modestobacter]MCZ2810535.1 TrkA family potassium uptake protein [Modestobacter sp. VKM Ac-2979]MCZ2842021.1 TrkA family potassium uptake protein [Modestobacter sp. VKM Ac-2980]